MIGLNPLNGDGQPSTDLVDEGNRIGDRVSRVDLEHPTARRLVYPRSSPGIYLAGPAAMPTSELRIRRATALIRDNLAERVTLGFVAAPLGISRFTLSRSFKAVMRESFREYLLRSRIDWARELLEGERSITEIALMVGFGDLPRFDKVFKAHTRMSPSAYRKKLLAFDVSVGAHTTHVTSP